MSKIWRETTLFSKTFDTLYYITVPTGEWIFSNGVSNWCDS